ncbi:uncharacterized protein EAF02_011887 [Botrytis sinoallii]|uniref:uncharacterized protein n=1 Tax=Botrytis sinoallii TaxID=1463999 RepID=UPI001901C17C|nr:uncharacterized protein EAF02_011887 [Botrytis sinoallii]KAF7853582.1 hypothetical protein EAF02_011887 [Botrytis sinoallii]
MMKASGRSGNSDNNGHIKTRRGWGLSSLYFSVKRIIIAWARCLVNARKVFGKPSKKTAIFEKDFQAQKHPLNTFTTQQIMRQF